MNPITIGLTVFAFTFAGALLGIYGRGVVPDTHLTSESKDIVKLSIGLIATMTALVLGLVVASAKTTFDTTTAGIRNGAAAILTLDRLLARYGSETKEIRDLLRQAIIYRVDSTWPEENASSANVNDPVAVGAVERLEDRIQRLAPQNDRQRWLQSRALTISNELLQARWFVHTVGAAVPIPFLVALVFWLTFIFAAFGVMAPRNATLIGILLISALSVAISIYLILELEHPFDGLIKVSSDPMRFLLRHLGR